jgi:hypothetical protein
LGEGHLPRKVGTMLSFASCFSPLSEPGQESGTTARRMIVLAAGKGCVGGLL